MFQTDILEALYREEDLDLSQCPNIQLLPPFEPVKRNNSITNVEADWHLWSMKNKPETILLKSSDNNSNLVVKINPTTPRNFPTQMES